MLGDRNFIAEIAYRTTSGRLGAGLDSIYDIAVWYARDIENYKYRSSLTERSREQLERAFSYAQRPDGTHFTLSPSQMEAWLNGSEDYDVFQPSQTQSQSGGDNSRFVVKFNGKEFLPPAKGGWRSTPDGFERLAKASRLYDRGSTVRFRLKHSDYPYVRPSNIWLDTLSTSFGGGKSYVVETNSTVIQRCMLMTTDPGDLVLDPTCGSGTTAYVAEQWGRRWITVDTSRVALALARARIMGARYPYYYLADSHDGQRKAADVTGIVAPERPTHGDIRQGFVYKRIPHVSMRSIANNAEIDVVWEDYQRTLEPLRAELNAALGTAYEEWEIPRETGELWPAQARDAHAAWWEARIARQQEIDASIVEKADLEYLYDRPYEDNRKVRVAGPFTVESLSPHRVLGVDEDGELVDGVAEAKGEYQAIQDFATMILENLRTSGVSPRQILWKFPSGLTSFTLPDPPLAATVAARRL